MTLHDYLRDEARRYFPGTTIDVTIDHQDEAIDLIIDGQIWSMDCGSDDDWYVFYSADRTRAFSIPLQPPPTEFDKLTPAQQEFILDNLEEDIRDDPYTYAEEIARGYAIKLDSQGIKDYLEAYEDMVQSDGD